MAHCLHSDSYQSPCLAQPCRPHPPPVNSQRSDRFPHPSSRRLRTTHKLDLRMATQQLRLALQSLPRYQTPAKTCLILDIEAWHRKEVERAARAERYVRLRRRSALPRNSPFHCLGIPLPDRTHVRCILRNGKPKIHRVCGLTLMI